ncbi:MAG: TraR/DksA family transcriptional regulator [Candidatus Blackburnbacteria bacterium]|nr:TraR/DksA family transcriptional regulator [Candidatus Blackburnbacteria bacterium]
MAKAKNNKNGQGIFAIPQKLLAPIGDFLTTQLHKLERRKSLLESDDPFIAGRSENFASPDTTAAEQFGHARTEAIRQELDKKIIQVRKALSRVKIGTYGSCENCTTMIDTDRLMVFPETTLCVACERKREGKKR